MAALAQRVFLFLFFLPLFSNAQLFRSYPSVTGKKDIPVQVTLQARQGQLWIGTSAGLVGYDGQSFRNFTIENGLVANEVSALFEAGDGTLWVAHRNGKITLGKNGRFTAFAHNEKLPEEPVNALCQDKQGRMFIGVYGSGVFILDGDSLIRFNSERGLGDDFVYTLVQDASGKTWAGSDGGITVFHVDKGKPVVDTELGSKQGLPDNIVRAIYHDSRGNAWIAMQDSGVCIYNTGAAAFKRIKLFNNWMFGTVTSLLVDHQGVVWIGTQKNGVLRYDEGKGVLKLTDQNNGLLTGEVSHLLEDHEKNIWIANSKGLSQYYQSRFEVVNLRNGLLSDKVLAVLTDSRGDQWVGSDLGVTRFSSGDMGKLKVSYYLKTNGELKKQVVSMAEGKDGKLWFGTYGEGLVVFDPVREETVTSYSQSKNGLANDNVVSIAVDKNGAVWAGTLGGGVSRLDGGKITNFNQEQGLGSDYVYSVFADSKGNVWCSTDGGGLVKFDGSKFVAVGTEKDLKSKTVYSITEDREGNLWFSSPEAGICRYDSKQFTWYSTAEGLRDNSPAVLTSDPQGNIIVAHGKGIDVLSAGVVSSYSLSDADFEPNLNAVHSDGSGNILVGTNNGMVRFRSVRTYVDSITPVLRLTGLKVQFSEHAIDSTYDFGYKQNNFQFDFTAIWMRQPGKVAYRYMLVGNDQDWSRETFDNTVIYSNLPPGDYTFKVMASNGEGKWSEPVEYSFNIAKPLWQRWWFWVLVLGFAGAGVYSFVKYRLRALQREKRILEEKVEERTAEIESKNKELERLSIVASETGNVIVIMDADARLEWVNQSFERLNGITLEDLRKLKGETIYDISNNPKIREIVKECITEKKSVVYESFNRTVDGKEVWESSTLTPIFENGKLKKLIIIDTDITERKRIEEVVRQKNKDITDSIEYAKKIQTSILPAMQLIHEALPQSFVFYLQKDIVSGDFYWFSRKGDLAIIAAVDCTGHGVPGAFMSLIGYNLLNQIVNEMDITAPGKILDELNKGVIKALYQNNPNNTSKDGMDLAICAIDLGKRSVRYAGAMRPLCYFENNNLVEIRGDKMSIGTREGDRDFEIRFTEHEIKAAPGTMFYIFSDGYADQFGGDSGKKMMTKNFKGLLNDIKDKPLDKQHQLLLEAHQGWKGNFEQVDDILVIGFKI